MKASHKKVVLLAALVFILMLSACVMPASTPPPTQPPAAGGGDFPANTQDITMFSTQTAQAAQPVQPPADNPAVATATPAADPNQGQGAEQPGDAATATPAEQATGGNQPGNDQAGGGQAVVTPAPTQALERPQTYTLKAGEHPYCIARRYNLDPGSFLSLNGMNNNSRPVAGTVLKVPATGNWTAGGRALRAHPEKHTVGAGETVYTIACLYGDVAPEQILQANGLQNAADVKVGTVLNIP